MNSFVIKKSQVHREGNIPGKTAPWSRLVREPRLRLGRVLTKEMQTHVMICEGLHDL